MLGGEIIASGISGSQWEAIGVVGTILLGVAGLYYMASQRALTKGDADSKRIDDAVSPYKEQIATLRTDHATSTAQLRADQAAQVAQLRADQVAALNDLRQNMQAQIDQRDDVIATRNRTIELREARIDTLEDQLREARR